ncbi:hypothetical protein ONS95_001585 [Cadophora gregata]|nr:uncharacterized protein ONS95_001585 [Cadophora gregata]KAK0111211.1 hypothetical protein ONS95_001585 [Cadophora gregata]
MSILREHLPPLRSTLLEDYQEMQTASHDALDTRLSELVGGLALGMDEIKQQISSSNFMQQRIESCVRGDSPGAKQKVLDAQGGQLEIAGSLKVSNQSSNAIVVRDSLREIYYLVFLYLGYFLKNLFLVLSRMAQPSRALMPHLLAKYNISFLDAIGRPARVLPYEYFGSFKVLQAFIQHEFRDLPGSTWVDQGRYLVLSLTNNQVLSESTWGGSVVPGSMVAMSMLLQQRLKPSNNLNEQQCPENTCTGTWPRSRDQSWATCPVCQKEVFISVLSSVDVQMRNTSDHSDSFNDSSFGPRPSNNVLQPQQRTTNDFEAGRLDENYYPDDDISIFKRIVQQFESEISSPPVERPPPVQTRTPLSVHKFPTFLRVFYPFHTAQMVTNSTTTRLLPAMAGELLLLHSISTTGWADATSLGSGVRGWFPTNYSVEYHPDEMKALLQALLDLWDFARTYNSNQQVVRLLSGVNRKIIAGVRSLLLSTNCETRQSDLVMSDQGIRICRKRVLAHLSRLVNHAQGLESILQMSHPNDINEEDVNTSIDEFILKGFKLIKFGTRFLDVVEEVVGSRIQTI